MAALMSTGSTTFASTADRERYQGEGLGAGPTLIRSAERGWHHVSVTEWQITLIRLTRYFVLYQWRQSLTDAGRHCEP